ncbi:hypothetical protein F5J12DRAFT_784771 [Pisolithus orientalis]|uniref:uncharacterized protein n=1 Tax=Pisolithus orientalis TaxID=936130 RepID=UPI00222597D4|nr:uncharacterized protein F5J12DRAFT_784771 [Pisolithus orientalis]KAI5998923.1 hypothetical protein F5J12DRAFT_784771 [Pisolithus orientalis]
MLYEEGKGALLWLQLEIIWMSNNQSIFAWCWTGCKDIGWSPSFLAEEPGYFHDCSGIQWMDVNTLWKCHQLVKYPLDIKAYPERFQMFMVTNHGIQIWLFLKNDQSSPDLYSVMLACRKVGEQSPIVIKMWQFNSNYSWCFYHHPIAWNDKELAKFKQLFLPYQDKVFNSPLARQNQLPQISFVDIIPSNIIIVLMTIGEQIIKSLIRTSQEEGADRLTVPTITVIAYVCISQGKCYVFLDMPAFKPQVFEVILRKLYDMEAIGHLRVITTMWDVVYFQFAMEVEHKLMMCCESLVKAGASCQWFVNNQESAWGILHDLGDQKVPLLFQKEMEEGMDLWETSALQGFALPCEM